MADVKKKPSKGSEGEKELFVEVVEGRDLVAMDSDGFSDPYVIVQVGNLKQKTKIINQTLNPVWDIGSTPERFIFNAKKLQGVTELQLICMDWDRFSTDDRMGMYTFKLSELEDGVFRDDWFTLKPQKKGDPVSGDLHLRVHLRSVGSTEGKGKVVHSKLWKAVKDADFGLVQLLLKEKESDAAFTERGSGGKTILHLAVDRQTMAEDSIRILRALIKYPKSDVTLTDDLGNSALHAFAKHFRSPACAEPFQLYMEKGASVNAPNKAGETALHSAVFNPSVKILVAALLLENKADSNAKSTNGETPLHFAVRLNRKDLVKLLISHGADTQTPGRDGLSPVGIARKMGYQGIADCIRDSVDLKKFLDQNGLSKYVIKFIEEELYLYILCDLPEEALSKYVEDEKDLQRVLQLAKENKDKFATDEHVIRKQQHFRALDEVRKRESDMRLQLRQSLMKSRAVPIKRPDEPPSPGSAGPPTPGRVGVDGEKIFEFEIDPADVEFVKSLGSGTSGEVFKGLYMTKPVAVKVLKSSGGEKEKTEFIAEFKIIAALNSDLIVHFFGAVVKDKLALVMEFCDRGSLYNFLQDEEVDVGWQRSLDMLEEVVKGIRVIHAHDPPIMHRDLKTLNVLVTHDYHCKLCDFGLARFDTSTNLGTLNNCRGTYAYIAPEVYEGNKFSLAADIYAVAIMTWEFVVRAMKGKYEQPYKEFSFIKIEFQIMIQASTKGLRPTIPPKFPHPKLISDVWQKDASKRPLSDELLARFAAVKKDYAARKAEWDALLAPRKEKK